MKQKHQEDLNEVVKTFNQLSLNSEDLDHLIHWHKYCEAEQLNDLGPTDQLEYLLGKFGKDELKQVLESVNWHKTEPDDGKELLDVAEK